MSKVSFLVVPSVHVTIACLSCCRFIVSAASSDIQLSVLPAVSARLPLGGGGGTGGRSQGTKWSLYCPIGKSKKKTKEGSSVAHRTRAAGPSW